MHRLDPVLQELTFPINGRDRIAVRMVSSYRKPVLAIERERSLNGINWESIKSFRLSYNHTQTLHTTLGRMIELSNEQSNSSKLKWPIAIGVRMLTGSLLRRSPAAEFMNAPPRQRLCCLPL